MINLETHVTISVGLYHEAIMIKIHSKKFKIKLTHWSELSKETEPTRNHKVN